MHICIKKKSPSLVFKNIYSSDGQLSEHKFWEFEVYYYSFLNFELEYSFAWTKRDHGGISFGIGIFGYTIKFQIYDHRHWNFYTNNWAS